METATTKPKAPAKPKEVDIGPLLDKACPSPTGSTRRVHKLWDSHYRVNWHLAGLVADSVFVTLKGDNIEIEK